MKERCAMKRVFLLGSLIFFTASQTGLAQLPSSVKRLKKAEQACRNGKYERCIEICNAILQVEPEYAEGLYRRGYAYLKQKNYKNAERDFDHAIKKDKKNATYYNARAQVRYCREKYRSALRDVKKAIKYNDRYSDAYITKGLCLKARARWDEAEKSFKKALELDPKSIQASNHLGSLYADLDQTGQAEKAYSKTLKLDSKNQFARLNRALLREKKGDLKGALADVNVLLKHVPNHSEARALQKRVKARTKTSVAQSKGNKKQRPKVLQSASDEKSRSKYSHSSQRVPTQDTSSGQAETDRDSVMAQFPVKQDSMELPELQFNFQDPCASQVDASLWGDSPAEPMESVNGAVLAPFVEWSSLTESQYRGTVSMAMEGMRLLYGELTEKEEKHFNQTWAAMFDYPTDHNIQYLQKLVPLLGQFLAGREAYLRTVAALIALQYELPVAVASDSQEGYEAIMDSAVDVFLEMDALLRGLKEIAAKIEALGLPTNPLDDKCQAQKRYRKSFPQAEHKPLRGLEGEWIGYVVDHSQPDGLDKEPIHHLYKYHLDKNPFAEKPMESLWGVSLVYMGPPTANETHWNEMMVENLDGDTIEYDYEREGVQYSVYMLRVGDTLPESLAGVSSVDVQRLEKLQQEGMQQWYSVNKMTAESEFTPDDEGVIRDVGANDAIPDIASGQPGEGDAPSAAADSDKTYTKGGITYYSDRSLFNERELEMTLKLTGAQSQSQQIQSYLQARELFHKAAQEWLASPPEESLDSQTRLNAFRARLEQLQQQRQLQAQTDVQTPVQPQLTQEDIEKEQARLQGIQDSIGFHQSMLVILRNHLNRERDALARESDPKRRDQLAFRIIQIQSNIQAEQDLMDSYKTGQVVHRRSVFDAFSHLKMIHAIKERVARVDAVRRIKRGIERQIDLLPYDHRGDMRNQVRRILDVESQANGDLSKARRLALAVNNKVQGYWEHEAAEEDLRAEIYDQYEKTAQTTVMVSAGLVTSMGSAAMLAAYGETAALAVWSPHIIGGVYGGTTGYLIGGPREGVKQAVAGISAYGAFAAEFVDTYLKESEKQPNREEKTKLWHATCNAGVGFLISNAVSFAANTLANTGMHFFGKDSALFKPVFSIRNAKNARLVNANETQQAVDDAMQYMELFKSKQLQYAKLKAANPGGSPGLDQLDAELTQMAASINSSYQGKWLMKYKAHPVVRNFYNEKINRSYDAMMPEMMGILKNKGYDVSHIKFKPVRNSSSTGSSSMDLDLALVEYPGLKLKKNGMVVSLKEFQTDAQAAMNIAYRNTTGYSAVRSDLNLTTSEHDEAFKSLALLNDEVDFSKISPGNVEHIGDVIQAKVKKITNDPVLPEISKMQARCRESNKEIQNMLLKKLKQQLSQAKAGTKQSRQLEADVRYWEDMSKRFNEMGTQETDPYRLLELEREIRMETGGKGSQEVIQDLIQMFSKKQ
ncbi:MAG: hypothetical protein CR997_10170 [Acidobacteria bacterium]|nr:MAG: hypothetical protein CR997_10170 [Acidobacteriota bacterium]